jgi:hypothetical protein
MNILDPMATWLPEFVPVLHESFYRVCIKHFYEASVNNYGLVDDRKQCNYIGKFSIRLESTGANYEENWITELIIVNVCSSRESHSIV